LILKLIRCVEVKEGPGVIPAPLFFSPDVVMLMGLLRNFGSEA
jgi:hypothetical protein